MIITVEGGVREETFSPLVFGKNSIVQLSVITECSYPPETAEWCLKIGENDKCSLQADWWNGIFNAEPRIEQIPANCPIYRDPDVVHYQLKLYGQLENGGSVTGQLYIHFMGKDYLVDDNDGQPYITITIGN